jgi:hypothetical protein
VVEDKLVDQDGLTFLFEVNGIRIFCGGQHFFTVAHNQELTVNRIELDSGRLVLDNVRSVKPIIEQPVLNAIL